MPYCEAQRGLQSLTMMQKGVFSQGSSVRGLQLGVFSKGSSVRGLQLGVFS